jgi:hypothetical protein
MRRRVRIGEGIYRDQYGLAAIVKVGNVQRERRFPFDCPEDEMKAWQATVRAMLWEDQQRRPLDAQAPETRRGTLAGDITAMRSCWRAARPIRPNGHTSAPGSRCTAHGAGPRSVRRMSPSPSHNGGRQTWRRRPSSTAAGCCGSSITP